MALTKLQSNGIAQDAITTSLILDDAITSAKILNGAVTGQKLSSNIQLFGTTSFLGGAIEKANVVASSVTSNININNTEESIVFYTGETDSDKEVTIDFLNLASVGVGNVSSYAVLITNNATNNAFISTALVDGASANVLRFIEGVPTGGSANIDVYSFSVIKTAASTYTVLGSKSEFRS